MPRRGKSKRMLPRTKKAPKTITGETVRAQHRDASLTVTLPAFAVLVLRQRAVEAGQTVSEVLASIVLDSVMVDEVQEMSARVPHLGEAFVEWFRATGRR